MTPRPIQPATSAVCARLKPASALLRNCSVCELRCGANRLAGERGVCGLTADSRVYKQYVSLNEEREIAPAWRVFLGGCNFRCPYCDEGPEAVLPEAGRLIEPLAWAAELAEAARYANVVSLLGGEPTLHVQTILATAAAVPAPLPLAVNSNMYMTPEVIDLLAGVVSWYLADCKFGNDACAERLAGVPRYNEVVRRNLLAAARQARVIVRHVLLPGHLDCCLRPVADWVAEHMPDARFQLYTGYVPCDAAPRPTASGSAAVTRQPAQRHPELTRLNTAEEQREAIEYVRRLGLRCHESPRCDERPRRSEPPCSDERSRCGGPARSDGTTGGACEPHEAGCGEKGLAGITIGADGRVYCHDLTPALAALLEDLACGETTGSPQMPVCDG